MNSHLRRHRDVARRVKEYLATRPPGKEPIASALMDLCDITPDEAAHIVGEWRRLNRDGGKT